MFGPPQTFPIFRYRVRNQGGEFVLDGEIAFTYSGWPSVQPDYWCGQFKPRVIQ